MQPVRITIRDIPNSDAIEAQIQKKAEKLSRLYDRIKSCHVVVDVPQKHKHQGKLFGVRIDLAVPGKELVVNRVLNEDLYVAIRDAFDAAHRQLEAYVDRQRGDVKTHQKTLRGKVARLFPEERYGFITAPDGREFYFHATNIAHPNYEQLEIGTEVEFMEVTGGDSLQAVHVIILEE